MAGAPVILNVYDMVSDFFKACKLLLM